MASDAPPQQGKESWDKFLAIIQRPEKTVKKWSEGDLRAVLNSPELSSLSALERVDVVDYWRTFNGNIANPTVSPTLPIYDVDFKDHKKLIITSRNPSIGKPFPGFFIGFPNIIGHLDRLIARLQGGHHTNVPSVTILSGVNKCGKTTLLTTVIPAYICNRIPEPRPIMVYNACDGGPCDSFDATSKQLYDTLCSKLRGSIEVKRDPTVGWETTFVELAEQLSTLNRHVVFFLDEYQGLFGQPNFQDVTKLANMLKKFMVNPLVANLHFVISSSNSPVLWSCLSIAHPNGRDILAEMTVVPVGGATPVELIATQSALAAVMVTPEANVHVLCESAWNPSPGMYAFLAENYMHSLEVEVVNKVREAAIRVHDGIVDRIKIDYGHLFSLSENLRDPRSYLWRVLLGLFSAEGISDDYFKHAMRYPDRLPNIKNIAGGWRLEDHYLQWYVWAHAGPHSGFSPDPVIDVPPDWEQAFTRFTSLFAAMYLFAIPHAQFENGIAHVFKADLAATKLAIVELFTDPSKALPASNESRLAHWMYKILFRGDGRQIETFKAWVAGTYTEAHGYYPMWQLCSGFRNFLAHSVEERAIGMQDKKDIINLASSLWGAENARSMIWEQVNVMYYCVTHYPKL